MNRFTILFFSFLLLPVYLLAGVTTYTFTSATWGSKVGAAMCDGTTDGWVCDLAGAEYATGRIDAQERLYSQGVAVRTGTSGAGATSVREFTDVRRLTFNFCQNSSKGRGTIHVQIGSNEPVSLTISKPAQSGQGVYNRDSLISFDTPLTGKIKFWVDCTENAIYINSITIRSANGGSSVFNMDTYQLVTNVNQLQDSDQVIFGVYKEGVNYIMGYYDEWESVNNIHAIRARYSADRMQVDPDERAVYTLRIAEIDGRTAYVFQDELRYEQAYLVASGGRTKNRLALWTDVVDPVTYGNYGFWDIQIEQGGEAVITNLGNSLAKIIQYNASNNPTLFACYQDRSQTPVCLYRCVPAMGDVQAIVAPFVNFGTTIETAGARTIQVNANRLTEDISVTHTNPEVFSLSADKLDRDGDNLTISYEVIPLPCDPDCDYAGRYVDTLVFTSGEVRTEVIVLLHLLRPLTVEQAVRSEDHAEVYLGDVVVTKKYDNYIYVRDTTGSMLLFDRGDGETGKRYGADLKAGDQLSGVTGRFINYFGIPELSPSEQFKVGKNIEVLPEQAGATIDSTDVCKYIVLDSAYVTGWSSLTYRGNEYAVANKFKLPSFLTDRYTRTYAIVSYDHDVVTLYIINQDSYPDNPDNPENPDSAVDNNRLQPNAHVFLRDGMLFIRTAAGTYTMHGTAAP